MGTTWPGREVEACRSFTVPLVDAVREGEVGAKACNLARLLRRGIPVPPAIVITNVAFDAFLDAEDLRTPIATACEKLIARSGAGRRGPASDEPGGVQGSPPIKIDKSPLATTCAADTIGALVREYSLPDDVRAEVDRATAGLGDVLIVRSSANGEDSVTASFAGQLDSIADVTPGPRCHRAVIDVWASRWSARTLSYEHARGVSLRGMGVIVQRQIRPVLSGVIFTAAPNAVDEIVVEYCAGMGDALVSGRENPGRVTVCRNTLCWTQVAGAESRIADEAALLNDASIGTLARTALKIEHEFGRPQDIEWALDASGTLWIVQARPITFLRALGAPPFHPSAQKTRAGGPGPSAAAGPPSRPAAAAGAAHSPLLRYPTASQHRHRVACAPEPSSYPTANFEKYRIPNPESPTPDGESVVWSNANVNENFPQPISPLLYSIASAGYYHYFRNLGRAFGISRRRLAQMEQPLRHIIGVHGARMYYNLTSIHAVLRSAPFGELLASSFNQFVGSEETSAKAASPFDRRPRHRFVRASRTSARAMIGQGLELCTIAAKTTWQYLFVTRRVQRFEQTVTAFAERTHPDRLEERSLGDLLTDFREFLEIRCHRWNDAALADTGSMVCYGVLQRVLARAFPGADQQALHNSLLKALPGMVSGIPAVEIWKLSELVRHDATLSGMFEGSSTAEILAAIRKNERFTAFRAAFDCFIEQWGFRCSGELMLTQPSFQENPAPLIDLIRTCARTKSESPIDVLAREDGARVEETRHVAHALRKQGIVRVIPARLQSAAVMLLLRATQRSILLRERARLRQALLYSRFRRVVLAIGCRLAADGRIAHADDIFFLTAGEIDSLLAGTALFPDHVQALVSVRRQAHADASAMTPPDHLVLPAGEYFTGSVRNGASESDSSAGMMRGVGVCGGLTTARAAILNDINDAHRLSAGDVLVARQTDPGWGPVFPLISGLVIERGGMLSHGAIIAREFGIPSVVGVRDATRRIPHGSLVRVDGDRAVVELVTTES